ncbi:MAG TPA: hypothetical protein DCP69_04155 [Candidatus Omnitrophica bacterium]|nr:hypothetical protein [Candidatus Omnitrophota bacterium]
MAETRQFDWAHGAVVKADAQAVGGALDDLLQKTGALETWAVVRAAEPEDSPLHVLFEWDNTTAAAMYRREQARYVIRQIRIIEDGKPIPAYVNVTFPEAGKDTTPTVYQVKVMMAGAATPARGWITPEDAMEDPVLRAQVLEDALKNIAAWRRRYSAFSELATIFDAIDSAQGQLFPVESAAVAVAA